MAVALEGMRGQRGVSQGASPLSRWFPNAASVRRFGRLWRGGAVLPPQCGRERRALSESVPLFGFVEGSFGLLEGAAALKSTMRA